MPIHDPARDPLRVIYGEPLPPSPFPSRLPPSARDTYAEHLWPLGTAGFATALPPRRCGLPGARLLGPGQRDFGHIDVATVKDALGSAHWHIDNGPVSMQLNKPAALRYLPELPL
jgi:hypothetical protein